MTRGFDRQLYVLSFDHRRSFESGMFGWKGALPPEQTAQIAEAKRVIYDGFKTAVADGVPKQNAAILVDEQFGAAILRDAKVDGFATACPVEKSGQDEFDFEYGENFLSHLEAFQPTFCKVLVRYNPEGKQAFNRRQTDRLKRLSHHLHSESRSLFMFELLVPAEKAQLERVKGDKKTYDVEIRPRLMVQTIEELQDAHVEPDVWNLEGLDRREDCERIVAAARYGGRDKVGCIVQCSGEEDKKVREWLTIASTVPGFIGFAVGRTDFWDPSSNGGRTKPRTRPPLTRLRGAIVSSSTSLKERPPNKRDKEDHDWPFARDRSMRAATSQARRGLADSNPTPPSNSSRDHQVLDVVSMFRLDALSAHCAPAVRHMKTLVMCFRR
jgi:myo-inositol catabolism protein IolC